MSSRVLLLEVRYAEGRYHGRGDWPPSPFRVFQALVAGAYGGRWIGEPSTEKDAAFEWLEKLSPPRIAYPAGRKGSTTKMYVPNNDLDSKGGDPRNIEEIRVAKNVTPVHFDNLTPILYAWPFEDGEDHAATIARLAERLHTLGLGVDVAYAQAEVVSRDEAEARLIASGALMTRPTGGASRGATCPTEGSLESLQRRYRDSGRRFRPRGEMIMFAAPAKSVFRQVSYDTTPLRKLFELVDDDGKIRPWPLKRVAELVERIRNAAAARMKNAFPARADVIHDVFMGRYDADEADKSERARIIPLPSIGHDHADRAIRRVVVEIPVAGPLRMDDVEWAFSGVEVGSRDYPRRLMAGADRGMLAHYGIADSQARRRWRSVTPLVLPITSRSSRDRSKHGDGRDRQKTGSERVLEEIEAVEAVRSSLRHAGVTAGVETIRVQRESFDINGSRADSFAETRFPRQNLWHAEITFTEAIRGPLVLGAGRYLGYGLMAREPERRRGVMAFRLGTKSRVAEADRADFLRAVRRAMMSLAADDRGRISTLFSGHEADGAKASSGRHRHIFLAAIDSDSDGFLDELVVAAPWSCDLTVDPYSREHAQFEEVVGLLSMVRAGRLGQITLVPIRESEMTSRCLGSSQVWESVAPYQSTWRVKPFAETRDAIVWDVKAECERRGLPRPEIEILNCVPDVDDQALARLRLRFATAVEGPILIGRDSHGGGGLFVKVRQMDS